MCLSGQRAPENAHLIHAPHRLGPMSASAPHSYSLRVRWTGARGTGTTSYRSFGRDHVVTAAGLPPIAGSADRPFHGDADRWNPELLLIASLAECHMLTYLHLATRAGVVVTGYVDDAGGELRLDPDGIGGRMTRVTLRPTVTITAESDAEVARSLHDRVPALCFIARSVSVPIEHEVTVVREQS